MMHTRFDVVIAGGGVIGSACAWFLAQNSGFSGQIAVVEPDPGYHRAASALSAGSIRQQFSTPVNIAISQFGIEFLRQVQDRFATADERPDVALTESTYLYLANAAARGALQDNVAVQSERGVSVRLCDRGELQSSFPWMDLDDIVAGSVTDSGEGWFDGFQLLMVLRKAAQGLGVRFIQSRAESVSLSTSGLVDGVALGNGERLECSWLVNATGTHARVLSAKLNIDLPVYPRKRCVYVFESGQGIQHCPLVIDPSGLWFRPEGKYFLCGLPPVPDRDVELDDFTVDPGFFEEQVWPLLAKRVPYFNAIKLKNFWAGHYDYNVFDQNAIVGPHPEVRNFLLVNGFSGHGLQQAPAIGRGICEFITYGEYRSLDLTPLSYDRIARNEPLIESNVI